MILRAILLTLCLTGAAHAEGPRILVMGDSLLAWHGTAGRSVADRLEQLLGGEVTDRSIGGARVIYKLPITGAMGLSIPQQFRGGTWDWVVINGGGNDLWFGCGCNKCDRKLRKLISEDGERGAIPDLVARIRASGARVLWLGYLRSPGFDTPVEDCRDEGDELEARIARMAQGDDGVVFHPIIDLVPDGDKSFHAADLIHPSRKASLEIARRLARIIRD